MRIEAIFRSIPRFKNIVLDTILFESRYPLMFTCKNDSEIYLFICCLVTADKVKWIGTRTTYENLLQLLENKITIREAFLKVTNEKVLIEYNGDQAECKNVPGMDIPDELLPTEGEFMDAEEDEYAEEIAIFKRRNMNVEYAIKSRKSTFWILHYREKSITLTDDYFDAETEYFDETEYRVEKIKEHRMALA